MQSPRLSSPLRAWSAVLAAAAACTFAVACGTVLDIRPDDGPADSAGAEADVDGGGSEGSTDAASAPVLLGALSFALQPARADVLAGTPASFQVIVTRPAGDMTIATLQPRSPSGFIIQPPSQVIGPGAVGAFTVTSPADSAPRKEAIAVGVTTVAGTVTLVFDLYVAREYRALTQLQFSTLTDQTYEVTAWGAGGGAPNGGGGGFATGTISAPTGMLVGVYVGGSGTLALGKGKGGTSGGGDGTNTTGGGGGYSAVFLGTPADAQHVFLVAGAGGGGTTDGVGTTGGAGGAIGAAAAQSGRGVLGGGGATTSTPGMAMGNGMSGARFAGGNGGTAGTVGGGGGGAGNFGGAGGASGSGGGGGSCLAPVNGSTAGGNFSEPALMSDPRRMGAGDPGKDGAVLIVPR